MAENTSRNVPDALALAGDIVVAFVSNNPVTASELPKLIANVHSAVVGLSSRRSGTAPEPEVEKPSTAQVRRSVQRDGLTSFLDGRTYKSLTRHLTARGLTPETYRARYGLPSDYPMVASSYSETRSNIARAIGLGALRARLVRGPEAAPEKEADAKPKSRRKARALG
ncbi:MucR family transcriptional regulator [Methylobacterium sp. P31]